MPVVSKQLNDLNVIVSRLAGEVGLATDRTSGTVYFTGWKEHPEDGSIVGQVVFWVKVDGTKSPGAAYVNLPGMECGVIPQGASVNIGTERLDPTITIGGMAELLRKGLEKMRDLIKERGLVAFVLEGK